MSGSMFGQAVSAEWTKALGQRWGLFWAYGFTPLAGLLLGIAGVVFVRVTHPEGVDGPPSALMKTLIDACSVSHNPLVVLFLIVGAANLFAGEYRWLTWRYLLVRNTRLGILGAKLAVFLALCAISVALFMVGGLFVAGVSAGVNGAGFQAWPRGGGSTVIAALLLGLLDLTRVGAIVALASVVSRSLTGAIVSVIVVLLALAFIEIQAVQQGVAWAQAILPGAAFDRLMAGAVGLSIPLPPGAAPEPGSLAASLAVLLAWAAIPAAGAAILFVRQDLSRE